MIPRTGLGADILPLRMKKAPKKAPSSRVARAASAPVDETIRRLDAAYPNADCSLGHRSPLELLVATILSAQCTDARVNQVTPELFRKFPDVRSLAEAPEGTVEETIRSTGFFNAKARSIRGAARAIVKDHGGEVPRTMEALHALPGVGRKTANVVLGNVWNEPAGVVVDTHVGRLARRLGWTKESDPEKVELKLYEKIPRARWVWISHALIEHGRHVCLARKPFCDHCPLEDICPKRGVNAPPTRKKS